MRKLAIFTMIALLAPLAILATSGVAKASIVSVCSTGGYDECFVQEDMGNGTCFADIWQTDSGGYEDPSGTFAQAEMSNHDTGYTCDAWVERNVNNSGWYQLSGTFASLPPASTTSAITTSMAAVTRPECASSSTGARLLARSTAAPRLPTSANRLNHHAAGEARAVGIGAGLAIAGGITLR
jgi:hypothetical protein